MEKTTEAGGQSSKGEAANLTEDFKEERATGGSDSR